MKLLLITKRVVLLAVLALASHLGMSQCTIIPNAVPGITLTHTVGVNNATGVAYNPNLNLYYIAQAGNPGFPLETFDAAGNWLYQTNTGFDMRGLWWNSNTNQLESNGYNTGGMWAYDLNGTGYALNTGTSVFTGLNQPTSQSVGDYNCVDDEIWYYNAGTIMKRDRATNALIGTFPITGLPVGTANLNNNTVFYTDCLGHEIGLLDYTLKRIYFVDKTTMAYTGMSQLPAGAITSNAFKASWANGLVWLLDSGPDIWYSYEVLTGFNTNCTVVSCTPPLLITDDLDAFSPSTVDLNTGINAGSGAGNASFYATLADANNGTNPVPAIAGAGGMYYVRYEVISDPTCFSVDSIFVTINPSYNIADNITVCENTSVTYPDGTSETITASTTHNSNLMTVAGCDSIIVTSVTMNPVYNISESITVCENTSVTYPDGSSETITASTTHNSNMLTAAGCDSIIVTTVTMNPVYNLSENVTICENASLTYPDGTNEIITANTSHTSNLLTWAGCDSIIVTNVTMEPAQNITENVNACENSNYIYPDGFAENITANSSHVSNLISVAGCDSIITTNVTMDPLAVAGTNASVTYCQTSGASDLYLELGGTPDAGGSWSPVLTSGTGVFDPASDASGTYTYTVTNPCGSVSADVVVDVIAIPDPGTNGTISFCSADPSYDLFTVLGGSPDTGGTWSPALSSGTGIFNPIVDPSGIYSYEFVTTCGTFSSQVNVTVNPSEDATFAYPGAVYCIDDTDPIPIVTGTSGGTFTISNGGVINPTTGVIDISASGAGGFGVTYTTGGACPDTYVYDITILNNADASINAAGPFCEGDQPFTLQAVNAGGTWSGPGVDPVTGVFDPAQANVGLNTISYSITGTCGDVQTITIEVFPTPTVTTIADTTIDVGNSVDLITVGSGGNYNWSPNIWLDCGNCESPLATPEETILYTVSLEENGCIAFADVLITVDYVPAIFVPNIFSPNGDQNNDVLYVRGQGIRTMRFIVYDRWGEKVFESTDKDDGWDGVFRGKKMNPAVFVYYLEGTYLDDTEFTLKGDVTLIR